MKQFNSVEEAEEVLDRYEEKGKRLICEICHDHLRASETYPGLLYCPTCKTHGH